jgi:tetratricopeptide (TPR) repeat protein
LALIRQRKLNDAAREDDALEKIVGNPDLEKLELPDFPGATSTRLARVVLAAELAGARGDANARRRGLQEAIARQDKLPYMEPPFWYFPIRQLLGMAYLDAGQPDDAERVYREDLKRNPENGWSLFGLLQSQRMQGKASAETETRFRDAWKHADIVLTGSCF